MEKVSYVIEVKENVARNRRDVYIVVGNERRHIFSIKKFSCISGFRFLLRQTKNQELGSLIDIIGLKDFNKVRTLLYRQIVSHPLLEGKYLFEFEREFQSDSQVRFFNINLSLLE
ncbi:MAG: hypothetical protein WCH65_04375 [bacterium]